MGVLGLLLLVAGAGDGRVVILSPENSPPSALKRITLRVETAEGPVLMRIWHRRARGVRILLKPGRKDLPPEETPDVASQPFRTMLKVRPGQWVLTLAEASRVELELFDVTGRRVTRFQTRLERGEHHLKLQDVPPATYFYRLKAGSHIWKGRMVILEGGR